MFSQPHSLKCLTIPVLLWFNFMSLVWLFSLKWNSLLVSPVYSTFTSKPNRETALDLYLKHLENSIMKAKPRKNKSNISTTEREALISLRKNKNIVIFEADKGGAVVIMNKSDYINEAKKHLNSVDADGNRIYKELSYDCTEKFVRDIAEAIGKAAINKVIDDDLADLLLVDSPKAGNIYFLPKIHKEIQPPP